MDDETLRPEDELELLKDRAKLMGIPLKGNVGVDTLKAKIAAKLASEPAEAETVEDEAADEVAPKKTLRQIHQETRERLRMEKLALVRCRIYNLDPAKRELHGEIITVANKFLGTVRKFIPFGEVTDNGWHIPKIIYDDLRSRRFQHKSTRKNKARPGEIIVERRMVPEYSIDVLPPLTDKEREELALQQAAAARLGA